MSNWLTYSVYSVLLVLGVDSPGSSLTFNTQCYPNKSPSQILSPIFPSPPINLMFLSLFICFERESMRELGMSRGDWGEKESQAGSECLHGAQCRAGTHQP